MFSLTHSKVEIIIHSDFEVQVTKSFTLFVKVPPNESMTCFYKFAKTSNVISINHNLKVL